MGKKENDKFKRWMIASFFLIPLILFGSIGTYYAYFPVKMRVLVRLLAYDKTLYWAREEIFDGGEKAIPYLIGGFASGNARVRSELLSVLVWPIGKQFYLDETVRSLAKGLRSRNANVRCSSVLALDRLRNRETGSGYGLPGLIENLSQVAKHHPRAPDFLRLLRENRVLPELARLLSDPEAKVRTVAADVLYWFEDESVVPHLIKALSDPEDSVRANAARALGRMGAFEDTTPEFIRLLSDPDARVRFEAAMALRRWPHGRASIPYLIKLLSDPDGSVRGVAARSLGVLRAKEATPQMFELLCDGDATARSGAVFALGKFQEEAAVPDLIKLLSDPDGWVREYAAVALGEIGSIDALGPLMASLKQVSMSAESHSGAGPSRRGHIYELVQALEKITGQTFGDVSTAGSETKWSETKFMRTPALDPEIKLRQIVQKWLNWWDENKEKYK